MVEKLKQLVDAYKDEYATLQRDLENARQSGVDNLERIVQSQMNVVRRHAIQLQGVIEGESAEYIELVKSFG